MTGYIIVGIIAFLIGGVVGITVADEDSEKLTLELENIRLKEFIDKWNLMSESIKESDNEKQEIVIILDGKELFRKELKK